MRPPRLRRVGYPPSFVFSGTGKQKWLEQNMRRDQLVIQNQSTGAETIAVFFGETSDAKGILLYPGDSWQDFTDESQFCFSGPVFLKPSADTAIVSGYEA